MTDREIVEQRQRIKMRFIREHAPWFLTRGGSARSRAMVRAMYRALWKEAGI